MNARSVTTWDGTVLPLPDDATIGRYAVDLYGEGHDTPLDTDSLVTIAAQVMLDAAHAVASPSTGTGTGGGNFFQLNDGHPH